MVDAATHEAVAIVSEHAMVGDQLVRILAQLTTTRGLPKAIRTDNSKEFCGRSMLNCAHYTGVQLFLNELGKTNQNGYIDSFNGRFSDECLNKYRFNSLAHARVIVDTWRREYIKERTKKSLRGHTQVAYSQKFMQNQLNTPLTDSKAQCN